MVENLGSSTDSKEVKEKYLLRNVEAVLAIALPKIPDPDPGNSPGELHTTPAKVKSHTAAPSLQDSLYTTLQFSKDKGNQQIRLLSLLPSSKATAEITMTLFCVPSLQFHKYHALSYTWGHPSDPKHTISLNGRPFSVGTNFHNALVSLRQEARPLLLWVDAICINQDDEVEKGVQVALMGAIYQKAERIDIFLGMATPKSYQLFEFLKRECNADDVTQENGEEIETEVVASFVEFCDREWWTRVWVMQEYYLANRAPFWYVGSQCVDGEMLCRDIRALVMAALKLAVPFGHTDYSEALGKHTRSSLMNRLSKIGDGVLSRREVTPYNTPRLLFAKHGRNATNARDYVYGVREVLEPHFRQVFVPDYGCTVGRLFEKLGAWFLLMDGWGDMLWYYPFRQGCGDEKGGEREGPSWAPDFSRRPDHLFNEPEPPKLLSGDPKTVHCAIVDRVLYIEGCNLDFIKEVIPMPKTPKEDSANLGINSIFYFGTTFFKRLGPIGMIISQFIIAIVGVTAGRLEAGNWSFEVLQKMWQLDRAFYSNQRGTSTGDTKTDRDTGALLAWATTFGPATFPLTPRWRETGDFLAPDFNEYVERIRARTERLREKGDAEAKASPESAEIQERYVQTAKNLAAAHGRQARGAAKLHRFLAMEMECDFATACVFDFANMDSQLLSIAESPDFDRGLDLILSNNSNPRDIVYEDLIRAIHLNSDPTDPTSFQDLVSIVRTIAQKVHTRIVTGTPGPIPDPAANFSETRNILAAQKIRLQKLKDGDPISCASFGTETERENHILFLTKQIETSEGLLPVETNPPRLLPIDRIRRFVTRVVSQLVSCFIARPPCEKAAAWSRVDEDRAAQFEGREFFVTKGGLLGLACPGVGKVKVGDRVVLLDGLSFPLVVRESGDGEGRLEVVGCANVKGVKADHKVEEVEVEGMSVGEKKMMAFA